MTKQSQPLRLEIPHHAQLITSKTINGALWFVNNRPLFMRICAFLAMYQEKYGVLIYHFELVGNHYHLFASFPNSNRSKFERDFNARIAESVRILVPNFGEGPLFHRRYTPQVAVGPGVEKKYFNYIAHQCVSSKLCSNRKQYPQPTLTDDAVKQIDRTYRYLKYFEYNRAKRKDPNISRDDYCSEHTLKFSRLPGNEHLTDKEYQSMMYKHLEEHRRELLEKMGDTVFLGAKRLRKVVPGSLPKSSKKGGRRPLVLSTCIHARRAYLDLYFSFVEKYQKASERFRAGEFDVEFPSGMFRPPGNTIKVS